MAQVSNDKPFDVIYSFGYYPILGYLLEAYAVPILNNGQLSLSFQQIHVLTAEYYGITGIEKEAIIALDNTNPKKLFKRFYNGKKTIKSKEWLYDVLDEKTIKTQVRPYIETQIYEAFEKISNRKIFISKDSNPMQQELNVIKDTSILFHLRRDERGTIYFPTFKANGETIHREPKANVLLTHTPPLFLIENNLLIFNEKLDGQKLVPFVNKKFIAIRKEAEEEFFTQFMVPLIEEYNVYSKGAEIISEKHIANAIIEISKNLLDEDCLMLKFKYGEKIFPYHTTKLVSVHLEKDKENYIFHRIKRSKIWENHKLSALLKLGLKFESGSLFKPLNNITSIEWLISNKTKLKENGFEVKVQENLNYSLLKPEIDIQINEKPDWFDVQIQVTFGEFIIPFAQLKKEILNGSREIRLPNGEIGIIPEEWISRISELHEHNIKNSGNQIRIRHFHANGINVFQDTEEYLNSKHIQLLKLGKPKEFSVPANFKGQLRDYQKTGFNWLLTLHELGLGGILADDMGLGKTIQTLAMLCNIVTDNSKSIEKDIPSPNQQNKPSLLILPTSLIHNWISEIKVFAPSLKIYLHFGYKRKKDLDAIMDKSDLIISTYGIARNDIETLKKYTFKTIILDESQNIKNNKSATAKAVKLLHSKSKFSLTGTPIENSLNDLWSQMDFANPGLLFNHTKFKNYFLNPIEKDLNDTKSIKLKELIEPFILGRKKSQVAPELPSKAVQTLLCGMTTEQESLYERIKSEYRNEILLKIEEDGMQKSRMHILSGLMKLRQIANHPKLVKEDFDSGKFDLLKEKLDISIENGHKILIFSQFVEFLKIIKSHLEETKLSYSYLDGQTTPKQRNQEVQNFKENKDIQVFLISLKAGGTGLNLQEADYVFMMDPWWNPAAERQAEDRAHRIGQTKNVHVYKFITKNTIEEKILKLQNKKTNISDKIINYEDSLVKNFDKSLIDKLLN